MDLNPPLLAGLPHRQRNAAPVGFILAFLLSISCSTIARSAQQSPAQLYEGLNVSTIDLVAQPLIDAEGLRPLVAQKPDTPYSTAEIQKTAAALQATGKFTKVEVEVNPETNGLRVTFILEPAFCVGMIHFPGATKVFSYQRLLQVVNYPAREPYQAARAGRGESLLMGFFAQQGYFGAHVKVGEKLDQARKLADIIYNVKLGRRARFGNIEISGPPPAETALLKGALRSFRAHLHGPNLKEGKRYDPDRLQAATQFLQDFLGKQNYFANTVHLDAPSYNPQTNTVTLHWQITLGPTVVARLSGAKLSQWSLRSLIPIYEENTFDQDLVQEGQRNLVSYFQSKGYFDVKISAQTSQDPSQISLVYRVDLGSRHRGWRIRADGSCRHVCALRGRRSIRRRDLHAVGLYSGPVARRGPDNGRIHRDNGRGDVCATRVPH